MCYRVQEVLTGIIYRQNEVKPFGEKEYSDIIQQAKQESALNAQRRKDESFLDEDC